MFCGICLLNPDITESLCMVLLELCVCILYSLLRDQLIVVDSLGVARDPALAMLEESRKEMLTGPDEARKQGKSIMRE